MIFGGIYGGVFTPTEAAGVAVVYSLFVAMLIYREVDCRTVAHHRRLGVPDFADPDDRHRRRHLLMADDDKRYSAELIMAASMRSTCRMGK